MQERFNSASRLHAILSKAASINNPSLSGISGWSQVLGIGGLSEHELYHEATRLLRLLDKETTELERQLEGEISERAYATQIASIRTSFSPKLLNSNWPKVRENLNAKTLSGLLIFVDVLEHDSDPISSADLDRVAVGLSDFKKEVRDSDLPHSFQLFLVTQIGIIERAMRDYEIVGNSAFADSFVEISINTVKYSETETPVKDAKTTSAMAKAWVKFKGFADSVAEWGDRSAKTTKLLEFGRKLLGAASAIDKYLN